MPPSYVRRDESRNASAAHRQARRARMIPSLTLSGAALAARSVLITSRSGFVVSLASVVLPVLIALLTSTALPALATPASSHMRERSRLQSTRATESQSTHAPDAADIVPNATSPTASSDAGVPTGATGGTGIVPERSPAQSAAEELRSSGTASTGGTGTTLDEAGEGSTSNTTGTGSMGSGSGSGPHDQTQTPTETQHSTSTQPTPQQSKQKEKQR